MEFENIGEIKRVNGRTSKSFLCSHCETPFWKRLSLITNRNFCSPACQYEGQKSLIETQCKRCAKPIRRSANRSKEHYCSHSCKAISQNPTRRGSNHPNWKQGKGSYRRLALLEHGEFCQNPQCIVTASGLKIPPAMLDVHHKDSNRENNQMSNLAVLCVWCHGLETRKVTL